MGVLIDSKLSWKSHIREISKKISLSVGVLAKMRHYANIKVLTKLYYAIIYPFLIYGLLAWGSTYPTTLKNIVILQKKAVRIIASSNHDAHTSVLFHQLSILKLSDLVSMHTALFIVTGFVPRRSFITSALFMFDFYNNTIPSSFSNFFTSIRKVHNYNTRLSSSSAYYTPVIRTNYGKFSLRYQGPLTWNSIDHNTKEINHRKISKEKIKAQFLKTYI